MCDILKFCPEKVTYCFIYETFDGNKMNDSLLLVHSSSLQIMKKCFIFGH